jgi:ADP-heptose:LPS heptosyltransferase
MIKNRNLFRVTRFILLKLPLLFWFLAKFRKTHKRLLVIKTGAIGDYILFRNYLEVVRNAEKFKNYNITLLGNELWQDLAREYDHEFVDNFIFINPESFYEAPLKTLRLGRRLFKNNYAIVLQPSYTRYLITDGLATLTAAKQIIGFEGDNEGIAEWYKVKTDKFYTRRLILPQAIYFEFDRSKFFFETVLNLHIAIESPLIPFNKTGKKGIVIFTGAGNFKRSWEKGKFLQLIKLIQSNSNQSIYLAGGAEDFEARAYLAGNLPPKSIINLIGKTSLPQLVDVIGNAALVIANETSVIHIAAATQTKAVCILGGGHFERFAPYPNPTQNKPVCVFEKLECYYCNWDCKFQTNATEPFPCISILTVEQVWQQVSPLLQTAQN